MKSNGVAQHRPVYRWPAPAWDNVATTETDLACLPYRPAGRTIAQRFDLAQLRLQATVGRMVVRELAGKGVGVVLTAGGGVRISTRHGRRRRAWAESVLSRHAAAVVLYLEGQG